MIAELSVEPVIQRLNPVVPVRGKDCFVSTAEIASIPVGELSQPIENLSPYRDDLLAAIDLVPESVTSRSKSR